MKTLLLLLKLFSKVVELERNLIEKILVKMLLLLLKLFSKEVELERNLIAVAPKAFLKSDWVGTKLLLRKALG